MSTKNGKLFFITINTDNDRWFYDGDIVDEGTELFIFPESEIKSELEDVFEALTEKIAEDGWQYDKILIEVNEFKPTIYKYQPASIVKM